MRAVALVLVSCLLSALGGCSDRPAEGHPEHGSEHATEHAGHDPGHSPGAAGYSRQVKSYVVPDVSLLGQDGEAVLVAGLLETETPVMLNFIFTSCTTICPVQTATFSSVQEQLAGEQQEVQMVSISIDPSYDTPSRLADYAERHGAAEPWRFLTGDPETVRRVELAFDAFRGDKMSHRPLTFLRARPDAPWLRLEGFPTAADLVSEYRVLAHSVPESAQAP